MRVFVYVTSHSGQLSLLLSTGWEMGTGHEAVAVLLAGKVTVGLAFALTNGHMSETLWYIHLYGLNGLS